MSFMYIDDFSDAFSFEFEEGDLGHLCELRLCRRAGMISICTDRDQKWDVDLVRMELRNVWRCNDFRTARHLFLKRGVEPEWVFQMVLDRLLEASRAVVWAHKPNHRCFEVVKSNLKHFPVGLRFERPGDDEVLF